MAEGRSLRSCGYVALDCFLNGPKDSDLNGTPSQMNPPSQRTDIRRWKIGVALLGFISGLIAVAVLSRLLVLKHKEHPARLQPLNLTLETAEGGSMIVPLKLPEGLFDYYLIDAMDADGDSGEGKPYRGVSCANGTIIHTKQTAITCGPFKACSNVSVSLRGHVTGSPEGTSTELTLQSIFIFGRDPNPPTNITILAQSPSRSKLIWEPPAAVPGLLAGYTVKICNATGSCGAEAGVKGCKEFNTSVASLESDTTVDTSYCVLVAANAKCGSGFHSSRPAFAEVRTASFAPGHFALWSTANGPRTVEIVVSMPEIKNGALDCCYGTLRGGGIERTFTCDDHGGESPTIMIKRLLPGTMYNCTVTLANVFDGREMATSESTYVITPEEPADPPQTR